MMVLVMSFRVYQEMQDAVIANSLMGVSHSILILLFVTGNKLALKKLLPQLLLPGVDLDF